MGGVGFGLVVFWGVVVWFVWGKPVLGVFPKTLPLV